MEVMPVCQQLKRLGRQRCRLTPNRLRDVSVGRVFRVGYVEDAIRRDVNLMASGVGLTLDCTAVGCAVVGDRDFCPGAAAVEGDNMRPETVPRR